MTEAKFRYETPLAFRNALKDRFGQIARTDRPREPACTSVQAWPDTLRGLADKLCATVGTYQQTGQPTGSTRIKDLVDIALIATTHSVGSRSLRVAVLTNAALRGLRLPAQFAVPDPAAWAAGYPRVAADAPGPVPDYDAAVILAGQLFDPVLDGTAMGTWDPSAQAWLAR
jgi:hypothetical protein